jgi:Protein of unknown function (DUF2934)
VVLDTQALEDETRGPELTVLTQTYRRRNVWGVIKSVMPKRKPVEAAEPAPVVAEPVKKTVRKASATKPKTPIGKAAHKHHTKTNVEALESTIESPAVTPVTREAIASLAYSFWEARGRQGGSAEQDWLRAERELSKLS